MSSRARRRAALAASELGREGDLPRALLVLPPRGEDDDVLDREGDNFLGDARPRDFERALAILSRNRIPRCGAFELRELACFFMSCRVGHARSSY